MMEGLFCFVKWKRITWNKKPEAAWIHCIKYLATEQHSVSVLALGKTCFEGLMTVVFPAACCLKCRKARSLEPFHLMSSCSELQQTAKCKQIHLIT